MALEPQVIIKDEEDSKLFTTDLQREWVDMSSRQGYGGISLDHEEVRATYQKFKVLLDEVLRNMSWFDGLCMLLICTNRTNRPDRMRRYQV
jgi:hypothetical protein